MSQKFQTIAVFGSADPDVAPEAKKTALALGKYLAEKGIKVITGGSVGVPGLVIQSAKENGAITEGFFPDHDPVSHSKRSDNQGIEYFDTYRFIPTFTARSLAMISEADGAVLINGRIGTLSEFCMAVEEGLPIAVVLGTGGIADELENIIAIAKKEYHSKIIFDRDYSRAIDRLLEAIH